MTNTTDATNMDTTDMTAQDSMGRGRAEMREAQLFWDDQDKQAAGWVLRWRDERGTEHAREISGDGNATIRELAEQVEHATSSAIFLGVTGTIRVYRGDAQRGTIELVDGEVVRWRVS